MNTSQYFQRNEIKEYEYSEELLTAIQLHFNKKIPLSLIKESLKKHQNDLFLSLKEIHEQLHSQLIEE